ncbi:MAG TPA: hypothetical protein VKA85_09165 [Candidatus Limnocylindrales bacterium]|nr:hypothetical protein [Candidatus Limnocylindrales bacterium]
MTVDIATPGRTATRKPATRRAKPRAAVVLPPPLVIGEPDKNIFNCPNCTRPLSVGASRCPGCRTRLILATPARKATIFILVGAIAGLVMAWGVSAAFAVTSAAVTPGPESSVLPSSPAAATSVPVAATPFIPAIPPTSRSALSQAGALNVRLSDGARLLQTALGERDLDSAAVADILRSLAADASFGEGLATRLAAWPQGAAVAHDLGLLYASVRGTAVDGLNNSINNDPAYRDAAQKMLGVLGGMTPLDGRMRTLAGIANVVLPPATSGK